MFDLVVVNLVAFAQSSEFTGVPRRQAMYHHNCALEDTCETMKL